MELKEVPANVSSTLGAYLMRLLTQQSKAKKIRKAKRGCDRPGFVRR